MFFLKRECLTIIGTAHVSANSVEEVKNTISHRARAMESLFMFLQQNHII